MKVSRTERTKGMNSKLLRRHTQTHTRHVAANARHCLPSRKALQQRLFRKSKLATKIARTTTTRKTTLAKERNKRGNAAAATVPHSRKAPNNPRNTQRERQRAAASLAPATTTRTQAATHKVHPDRRDVAFRVGVIGEPQQQTRLPHARVSDQQQLKQVVTGLVGPLLRAHGELGRTRQMGGAGRGKQGTEGDKREKEMEIAERRRRQQVKVELRMRRVFFGRSKNSCEGGFRGGGVSAVLTASVSGVSCAAGRRLLFCRRPLAGFIARPTCAVGNTPKSAM